MNLTQKILASHLVRGTLTPGEEIAIRVDQTLTQDALGMIAYLTFEQMGKARVQTECSVSYLDHNMLYTDFKNPDDHAYLRSVAQKYGIWLSRAGNGICHSVHLARFAKPGKTLIGTDSHTPSAGAAGMLGIGAGGVDVAAAMAGEPLVLRMPKVVRVLVKNELPAGVNAKDAALWLTKKLSVKGGLGLVLEYAGEGLQNLSVPQRMTLANMGAETGATSSVFPSDEQTRRFFAAQHRLGDFAPLHADPDAAYEDTIELDLAALTPMAALPHQPDNVQPVSGTKPVTVDQVFIGSCTNSSYTDLTRAAAILKGHTAADTVSLVVSPGTRQNYRLLLENGAIETFIQAGARILECACGPCVGMGQAVRTGGVSLRTSNRNFKGRCGTLDSQVYLVSPETAAASAVLGHLATAEELDSFSALAEIHEPDDYGADDAMLLAPPQDGSEISIVRGPNIRPIPAGEPLAQQLDAQVVIRLGDNVSTDEIAPATPQSVASRANIPEVSKTTFCRLDPAFWQRASRAGCSVIVAGENYGQGSSREHAALMPMYLGVKAVLAKSFARIHRTNLINFGILPLRLRSAADAEQLHADDMLRICAIHEGLSAGCLTVRNLTRGGEVTVDLDISPHERELLLAGGLLGYIRQRPEKNENKSEKERKNKL